MKRGALSFLAVLALVAPGAAQAADKVRASIFKIGASTNAWIAKTQGFFARNGLDVDLIEFRNGNEAVTANRGGSVDLIMSIPGTVMVANERGFGLVLLTQNEIAHAAGPDAGSIQVLKDSPYQKLADLAGKKIAVSGLHSQMTVAVQTALEKSGVDFGKMQQIELPLPNMNDALRNHQVDAIAQLDPFTTQLTVSGASRVLSWLYVDSVPEQPIGAWYAQPAFIAKNRDLVMRYVKSLQEAIDWLGADEGRARRAIAEYTGLDPKLIESMPVIRWSWRIDRDRWQATVDMMHKAGELAQPHKADEYISDIARQFVVK
jgi:NitT/TauT family transport system substrate-binding protein